MAWRGRAGDASCAPGGRLLLSLCSLSAWVPQSQLPPWHASAPASTLACHLFTLPSSFPPDTIPRRAPAAAAQAMLSDWVDAGVVVYHRLIGGEVPEGIPHQAAIYQNCLERYRNETTWLGAPWYCGGTAWVLLPPYSV